MRSFHISLFLLLILLSITLNTQAQTCSGSLGDPVICQTFGSGAQPGPALPAGLTNLQYTTNPCAEDGYYTLINATSICHSDWHIVIKDHTGDKNGLMMLINASVTPNIFFTQTASALCANNTTYEFSALCYEPGNVGFSGAGVFQTEYYIFG